MNAQFFTVQNKTTESIEQFVNKLRKLSQYCEYGNKTDEHIRDQVIDRKTRRTNIF